MGSREARLNTRTIYFADVDKELNLPPSSAKKHLNTAGDRYRYVAEQEGPTLILFRQLPLVVKTESRWGRGGGFNF